MGTPKIYFALVIFVYITACSKTTTEQVSQYQLQHRITDHAGILTSTQRDSLTVIMEELESEVGSQIAILTIPNLDGVRIEELSFKTAEGSGLGRATYNDGVLITVAYDDRKVRIEVGTGLENILGDELVKRIITEDIAPKFREQKFGAGLYAATRKIAGMIKDNRSKIGQEPGK